MNAEIGLIQLQDICTKVCSGGTPSTRNKDFYIDGVVPWVKTKEVNNNKIVDAETYITDEALAKSSAKLIPENSVIVAMYGNGDTAGRVAINKIPVATNQACCNLIVDPEKADYRFVFYYLRTQYKKLVDLKNGGAQQNLNAGMLKEYPFPDFSLDKQIEIADVLESFDDKIELNRQTNQTLEHMAQAIFKSWFVDFEPTCVKAQARADIAKGIMPVSDGFLKNDSLTLSKGLQTENTKQYLPKNFTQVDADQLVERAAMAAISGKALSVLENLSPETLEQLKTTAAFFPETLVDSELGEIPEGWEIKRIRDLGKVLTGKTPPKKIENAYSDAGVPFVTPTDIDDSMFVTNTNRFLTEDGEASVKKTRIKAGTICVTCIGSQMGKAIISPKEAFTNQQINSILPNENYYRNYLLLNLRNRRDEIFLIGSSGSTMPIINKSTFEKLEVLIPSASLLSQFDCFVTSIMNKILEGDLQSKTLSSIRDLLLSKLLSGELVEPELPGGI